VNYLDEQDETLIIKQAQRHTFIAHHDSPTHNDFWPRPHQHNTSADFTPAARNSLKSHLDPSHTLSTTHSCTELTSCVEVPWQECTTGGWLSASDSAGLFWGISRAHLFDPKHSASSPPAQSSSALGRNQDVILNWLKRTVCLGLSFLFFYILPALYCAAPFSPRPLWSLSCHSKMSLCGQDYREYVLDKDAATLFPTSLYLALK